MQTQPDTASPLLRRGLLWLAATTTLGIAAELATARHWTQPSQLIAWGALALIAPAVALLLGRPSAARVRVAQGLAILVAASALAGVWQHIYANYEAGPLDYRYAETWESMSDLSRWWLAATEEVGPSPPLAAGALAVTGACVLLATLQHPALRGGRATPRHVEEEQTVPR